MPSALLQRRIGAMSEKIGGKETVKYFPFEKVTPDSYGDVDESLAYPAKGIPLTALISYSPSRALRERLGLEQGFEAFLRVSQEHMTGADITPDIGDAIELPGSTRKLYVTKVVKQKQAGSKFLELGIAVTAKMGRR